MKKVVVAVLTALCAVAAHAGDLMYATNQAGGLIVLTDAHSQYCANNSEVYYTTNMNGGNKLYGCWSYQDPWVLTTDNQGLAHQYPVTLFTPTAYGKQTYGSN